VRRSLILLAVGALLLGACSSSSSASTVTPPAGGGGSAGTLALNVKDFAFTPATLTANAGTVTVTIANAGPSLHNFSLDDGSVSQDIQPGASQTVTLNLTAGTVSFHCKYHTQMTGTITVT
jgi:plastocyanin